MQPLSIARSLRLALVGLTLVLAVVAALGVSSLYSSRQTYENELAGASELATAAANLTSAGIAEDEVLRDARGRGAATQRRRVAAAYRSTAANATTLARSDPPSAELLQQETAAQALARQVAGRRGAKTATLQRHLIRARTLANALQARQQAREDAARHKARSHSRRAIILVLVAGLLALISALALITALVAGMRRPLDDLVEATRDLAAGSLDRRVQPAGPRELLQLGTAFNAMGSDLAQAQEVLDRQRRRLAVTIESLGDGLLVTEPDSTTIATVNPRASDLVPELQAGSPTDGPGSPLPPLAQALAGEQVIEHQGRTLAITAAALGTTADGVVWTVRDVSERARLERAKSEFVATASHELRSPLTSIKGFVELLEHGSAGMTDRQREWIDIILRSTDRLVELVNDLLDVARIEADNVEINLRPIEVGEAIREIAEMMGPRVQEKRQQLTVQLSPALPLALADPSRVRQIVANLVTNAHLYTAEAGTITVSASGTGEWVQIAIADSGVGIAPDEVEHVFERFYRGSSDGRKAPGTGLGLSIVKSLVDMHHGTINVESTPGRGTTFTVRLPAALIAADGQPAHAALRGRRVLIVDDELEIAEMIAAQLRRHDVRTTIAAGGDEALALLRSEPFDAVTLDVRMPGIDGFETLRRVREDPRLKTLPVVFVSVFSGQRELAGEWAVNKPVNAEQLRTVLGAAVRAGRTRVLVVGRDELRPALEPSLEELGIEHRWETTGPAAARACEERHFEVALVDVGVRNPQAVLQSLDLRGRRLRRAVILFSGGNGDGGSSADVARLGLEVVPVEAAARALVAALRAE